MTYVEPQPSGPDRSRLALIGGGLAIFLAAAGATILVMMRPGQGDVTPTPGAGETPSPGTTASPVQTLGMGETTGTPPATASPLPPYEHQIVEGQELFAVIGIYYPDNIAEVLPAVLALNGITDPNSIQAGQVLLIPRPTVEPTPTPDPNATPAPQESGEAGVDLPVGATSPASEQQGGDPSNRVTAVDGRFWVHTVREGETIASIARAYDSSVPCILQNNNFSYSGQEPVIFVGQQVNVCIVVTLTPTPSPTGDPFNSTATPTPTLSPPILLSPVNGVTIGRSESITLQWVTTYPLRGGQRYLVIVQDLTNNRDFRATTTDNAFTLPNELRPGLGEVFNYEWRVVILQGDTTESPMVSGLGEPRQFTWGG